MHELTDAFVKTQRDLGIQLSRVSELPDALGLVLEAAVRIEGIDGGGVYTVDRQAGEVRLLADRGLSPRFVRQVLRYPLSSPVSRRAMRGRPYTGMPPTPPPTRSFGRRACGRSPRSRSGITGA
jgi:hypothetical protein